MQVSISARDVDILQLDVIPFWVVTQPNVDGFCFNMGHYNMGGLIILSNHKAE